jgi:hypothetical protein
MLKPKGAQLFFSPGRFWEGTRQSFLQASAKVLGLTEARRVPPFQGWDLFFVDGYPGRCPEPYTDLSRKFLAFFAGHARRFLP